MLSNNSAKSAWVEILKTWEEVQPDQMKGEN